MLEHQSLNIATELTQSVSAEGVTLSAYPETPLALLLRAIPVVGVDAASTDYASLSNTLVEVSRNDEHAIASTDVVKLASDSVRGTLDFTRNTVMPHIRRVIEAYGKRTSELSVPVNPFNVNYIFLPEVYKISGGREFLYQWENTPAASSPDGVNLGEYSPEEILQLARMTDNGGFNDSVQELLTAENGKGIQAIAGVLSGASSVSRLDPAFALPLAIVLRNIEEPKAGVGLTLSAYNATRAVLGANAARQALDMMSKYESNLSSNILYAGTVSTGRNDINVNGEVFRALSEKGLTVEMLLGNELLGRKYRGLQLLEPAAMEEMTKTYERDKGIRQAAHTLNQREHARKALMEVLREDQQLIANANGFVVEGDSAEKSWSRLKSFIDNSFAGLYREAEPSLMIAAAICAVWYLHTDAARVIDIMFSIEKEQPQLPSKEVATLATLRYIAEWVASQIVVTKQ